MSVLIYVGAFVAMCAVIVTCEWHANRPVRFRVTHIGAKLAVLDAPTEAANALAAKIAEHLDSGGNVTDILAGRVICHPCGDIRVELITRTDDEAIGDEAAAWLRSGAGA